MVLSQICVHGCGAVSPAGWGVSCLYDRLGESAAVPASELARPGCAHPVKVRSVPPPASRPAFLGHPRLRRSSSIAQYVVAAAIEALGSDMAHISSGNLRLGIVFCAMSGCVNFSRRFCDEMLKDPATASPLIFPETVFNAPASHLAALLGTDSLYYTLIGDPGTFLQGVALAAGWLAGDKVDGCLVLGAEEQDWLVAEAFQLFDPEGVPGAGAGALYLRRRTESHHAAVLSAVTAPYLFTRNRSRLEAARCALAELGAEPPNAVLCDGRQGVPRLDQAEEEAGRGWRGARLSPKFVCGDGLMAAAAWQCVVAVEALSRGEYEVANVSVVGHNQQAIAAQFVRAGALEKPL